MSLFEELKRRNVFRVAIAYGVAAWLLLQLTDIVTPILQLPDSIPRVVLFLLVIGIFPAIILAWAFELTPEGVKLESEVDRSKSISSRTGRKLDRTIIVVLAIGISFLLVDKFVLQDKEGLGSENHFQENGSLTPNEPNESVPSESAEKSVAVLPFVTMSSGPDDEYFSDGLTEEIINALAQLPELLVTARTSAFHFKGKNIPIAEISGQLGVDHIVEGSVRRAGEQLRITAQLVRASDGFHLWSETYDRKTEDTLAVQSDIAEKVASALNVILDFKQRARMKRVGIYNVDAYTAYQKASQLSETGHSEGPLLPLLKQANQHLEQAISLVPNFYTAHVLHSDLYTHQLITHANGQLDGDISEDDLQRAPPALKTDLERAVQSARNDESRLSAEFDSALILGDWRGLASRSSRALQSPGCTPAYWSQLTSGAFGQAELLRQKFARFVRCDPVSHRAAAHMLYANLWMSQTREVIALAESGLQLDNIQTVSSAYIIALAAEGRADDAQKENRRLLREENEQLVIAVTLAAQAGEADLAGRLQGDYLGKYGPDDYRSLIMEAIRGERSEANRLAGQIDRRPFGYMTLMQAVYFCLCGAPFDLEAAPIFASMLDESGLPWPPARPIPLPLKDW